MPINFSTSPWLRLHVQVFAALGLACQDDCDLPIETDPTTTHGSQSHSVESTSDTSSSTSVVPYTCQNPTAIPLPVSGQPSGYVRCDDGLIHRQEQIKCEVQAVAADSICSELTGGECQTNDDCTERPGGYCHVLPYEGGYQAQTCGCAYQCQDDAECGPGNICSCVGVSTCVAATCQAQSACGDGLCAMSTRNDGCASISSFACLSPQAQCQQDEDCGDIACENSPSQVYPGECVPDSEGADPSVWHCVPSLVCDIACGRPYLVDHEPRMASACPRADWLAQAPAAPASQADAGLAHYWTTIALAEHASVASFARTLLHLLALAAPAELIEATSTALHDEIRHAKLAFSLAAHFGAPAQGPGNFPLSPDDGGVDIQGLIVALVREACIGETLAAAEIAYASQLATIPAVRQVLQEIADDEARHAALGWRTLTWLVGTHEPSRALARQTFATASVQTVLRTSAPSDDGLPCAGQLSSCQRAMVRDQVFKQIIEPSIHAIFGDRRRSAKESEFAPSYC